MMDWKILEPVLVFGDYSEVYAEESYGQVISFEDGKTDEIESGQSNGLGLRYVEGEETRFGHVDGCDQEPIFRLKQELSQGLKTIQQIKLPSQLIPLRHKILKNPLEISLDKKIEILQRADHAAHLVKGNENIRQVSLTLGERVKKIFFFSVPTTRSWFEACLADFNCSSIFFILCLLKQSRFFRDCLL